jgi:hypothetical protein
MGWPQKERNVHTGEETGVLDAIQKAIVRLVATSPAGHNLSLIGGFRYRFLNKSVRTSRDIDYHWPGELAEKQIELAALFKKRLLPSFRRQFGYDGSVEPHNAPGADSPAVRTVLVAVWKPGVAHSRIEVPIEVTRICHLDKVEVRTVDGVVYPTLSDADLVEGKILAVFNRVPMAHRDLVDIFLFANTLPPDSPDRVARKLKTLGIEPDTIREKLDDLGRHAAYHAKAVQAVIETQLAPAAAKSIAAAGGGAMVMRHAAETIRLNVRAL